jgi:CheY-like chemotaxis protein
MQTLLVSSNDGSRGLVEEALQSWGATVSETTDEESALTILAEADGGGPPYSLLFLDLGDLGLDHSPNHMKLIKAAKDYGVTVIIFVSDVRSINIRYAYSLGLGGYAAKPLTKRKLAHAIGMAMKRSSNGTSHGLPYTPTDLNNNAAILIADDSPDNRLLIRTYLKHSGYQLDMAETGKMAVELYQAGKYDLVLMDVQMPVMDGHTATRMIRDWEKKSNASPVPIIALTAHAFQEEIQKSLAAGCSDHLTKPIRKDTLLNAMQKWVKQGPPKPHQQISFKFTPSPKG